MYSGKNSYSMYLSHPGILTLIQRRFDGFFGIALAFILTIAYGAISWSLIESRLLNCGADVRPQANS
jgi:peptidoglycan/LPS O-acetylase OafA/YrhL